MLTPEAAAEQLVVRQPAPGGINAGEHSLMVDPGTFLTEGARGLQAETVRLSDSGAVLTFRSGDRHEIRFTDPRAHAQNHRAVIATALQDFAADGVGAAREAALASDGAVGASQRSRCALWPSLASNRCGEAAADPLTEPLDPVISSLLEFVLTGNELDMGLCGPGGGPAILCGPTTIGRSQTECCVGPALWGAARSIVNGAALILRRASLDAWDEATATPRVSDHSVWTTLESAAGTIVKATDSLDAQIPCSDAATLETPNAGLEDVYVGIRLALDSVGVTVDLHMPPSPTGHADATGAQGFERLLAGTPPPAWEARAPQSQNGAPSPEAGFEAGTPLERATGARLSAVPAPGPFAVPAASLVLGILLGLAAMLPVLALYHRIRRQQALSPAKRRRIYDLVEADPGVTPAELQAATGLHYTTCVHHLRILRDLGIVESIRIGRHLHYFVAGAGYGAVEKRVRASMRSPTPGRLLALLAHRPGTSIANAARSLCVRAPSLRHHTDRLTRAGLLEIRKEGGRTRLCLAPAAVDHTLRLLPR